MRRSKNWLSTLLLDFILIVDKQIRNLNNKNRDLEVKIYLMILKIMPKRR